MAGCRRGCRYELKCAWYGWRAVSGRSDGFFGKVTPSTCGPARTASRAVRWASASGAGCPAAGRTLRLHRERLDARPIQQDLDLVRLGQPLDLLVTVAPQADRDVVLAVLRERVGDDGAAAGAEWQALDVLFLREVRRHPECVAARRAPDPADREPADLLGRREVAFEQRRRKLADGDVVEAVAGFVGRQQGTDIDVQGEQVADGVAVFGACQPADRRRSSRVGVCSRGAVESGLERRDDGLIGRVVRARLADGRHLSRAQLLDHLLPGDRVRADVARHDRLERQIGLLRAVVVTVQAVLLDQVAGRCDDGARAWRGRVGGVCGQPEAAGRHEAGQPDHRRGPARRRAGAFGRMIHPG